MGAMQDDHALSGPRSLVCRCAKHEPEALSTCFSGINHEPFRGVRHLTNCSYGWPMLEPGKVGAYLLAMSMEGLLRKIGAALLALTVLVATAPVVAASAPTPTGSPPCNCPSAQLMKMNAQDSAPQIAPAKEHGSPCNDAQNCICGVSCGAATNLPQSPSAVASPTFQPQQVALSNAQGGHGISIRPAIPPPILIV